MARRRRQPPARPEEDYEPPIIATFGLPTDVVGARLAAEAARAACRVLFEHLPDPRVAASSLLGLATGVR